MKRNLTKLAWAVGLLTSVWAFREFVTFYPSPLPAGQASETEDPKAVLEKMHRNLEERERALEKRAAVLRERERELETKEAELLSEFKRYQRELERLRKTARSTASTEGTGDTDFVKIYQNMEAKRAARIFDGMEPKNVGSILREMRPTKAAEILGQMDPRKAREITRKFGSFKK